MNSSIILNLINKLLLIFSVSYSGPNRYILLQRCLIKLKHKSAQHHSHGVVTFKREKTKRKLLNVR